MAALVQEIHVTYLGYMAKNLSGTTRPGAISGVMLALSGAGQGQVGNYINAAISGAVDLGVTDAATYNAFDNRYQALGLARGQQMLNAAGERGISTYLVSEDLTRQIERLTEARVTISGVKIPALQLARSQVAAASGLSAASYPLVDKAIGVAIREQKSGVDMLTREIQHLTERLG